jgi:hypothetical protein
MLTVEILWITKIKLGVGWGAEPDLHPETGAQLSQGVKTSRYIHDDTLTL